MLLFHWPYLLHFLLRVPLYYTHVNNWNRCKRFRIVRFYFTNKCSKIRNKLIPTFFFYIFFYSGCFFPTCCLLLIMASDRIFYTNIPRRPYACSPNNVYSSSTLLFAVKLNNVNSFHEFTFSTLRVLKSEGHRCCDTSGFIGFEGSFKPYDRIFNDTFLR